MSIFKCKMCGGDLEIQAGQTVAQCEYCGTKQTLPRLDGDRKANLYDRANHFRRNNDYDKAMGIYEQILTEDNTDAEAYWSLVLCRYGIEYVEDPATHKRIPTVNRAQYTSIFDDEDYKSALEHADSAQREVYESEAKTINEIQKGILAISQKEDPFDVFICYKETDSNGRRTQDSVLANDLYHQLTQEGFKVFFSRITLEDKLGTAYEPYIFAALNSAKVMVVLGTRPEYFNAVWVKNEWSRYLALIRGGAKKVLIPAYRDMDPYDLPEEFSHLQAQDMSKLGFMQDLIRGIKKLTESEMPRKAEEKDIAASQQVAAAGNVQALLDRGNMALEDGEWEKADGFFEEVLNQNARCAEAYIGKALAEAKVGTLEAFFAGFAYKTDITITESAKDENAASHIDEIVQKYKIHYYLKEAKLRGLYQFDFNYLTRAQEQKAAQEKALEQIHQNRNINRAMEFAHGDTKVRLDHCIEELERQQSAYLEEAKAADQAAREKKLAAYRAVVEKADQTAAELYQEACEKREKAYQELKTRVESIKELSDCRYCSLLYSSDLKGYRDSDALAAQCAEKERELEAQRERDLKKHAKRVKTGRIIGAISACVVAAFLVVLFQVIIPTVNYHKAVAMMENGDYNGAIKAFIRSDGYNDAAEQLRDLLAQTVSCMGVHTVGLRTDGTVIAVGESDYGQCNVSDWTDIVSVSAGGSDTVGLKSDGTVMAIGADNSGRLDVSDWTNIVAVSAGGGNHTVGLRSDGTVVAAGFNGLGQCDVSSWRNIVSVSASAAYTVGLRSDGTVVATGDNDDGQCDVSDWTDIVSVGAGGNHTVGLRADGTVVATGDNDYGQCDVSGWTDIVAVSAGAVYTVGLRSDGTVVATGDNGYGQCDVSAWTDIVAVSAGGNFTVGLRADGTVVATGRNDHGQCDVSGWTDIKVPE